MSFLKLSNRSLSSKEYKCTIRLLDDTETLECYFNKNSCGQFLVDHVCDHLSLLEKDYFGIRFMDNLKQRYWLDPQKPILKQIKGIHPIVVSFRVKFYPSDPTILKEELTRYQLFLQLKRDLLHGRLYCTQSDSALLGAFILQAELGDFDDQPDNYVAERKLLLKQTQKVEEKIGQNHKTMRGQVPAEAELNFLKRACQLDTYGFDPYSVKDVKFGLVYLGVTHQGVLVYQSNRKVYHFEWGDLEKLDYVAKDFILVLKTEAAYNSSKLAADLTPTDPEDNSFGGKHPLDKRRIVFRCPGATFAKRLWKYSLEQKTFFTVPRASEAKPESSKKSFFKRGSTFRYSGRVLNEIKECLIPAREPPAFERFHPPNHEDGVKQRNVKYSTLPSKLPSSNGAAHNEVPPGPPPVSVKPLNLDTTSETSAPITHPSPGSVDSSSLLINSTSYQSDVVNLSDSWDVSPRISTVTEEEIVARVETPNHRLSDQREEKLLTQLNRISGSNDDGVLQVRDKIVTVVTVSSGETQARNSTVVYNTTATFTTKSTSTVGSQQRSTVLTGVAVPPPYKNGSTLSGRPDPANYHFPEKETIEIVELPNVTAPNVETCKVESVENRSPETASCMQLQAEAPVKQSGNLCWTLTKVIARSLCFVLLLLGVAVVVMEIPNPEFQRSVSRIPRFEYLKAVYYQPWRDNIMALYTKRFG